MKKNWYEDIDHIYEITEEIWRFLNLPLRIFKLLQTRLQIQTQKPSLSKEIEKLPIIDDKVEETILNANLPIDSKEKNPGEKMASLKPQNLPSTQVLVFQEGKPSDTKNDNEAHDNEKGEKKEGSYS